MDLINKRIMYINIIPLTSHIAGDLISTLVYDVGSKGHIHNYKNFVNVEFLQGRLDSNKIQEIKRIFFEYACDYMLIDSRGFNLSIIDGLAYHMYSHCETIYPRMYCCNNPKLIDRVKDKIESAPYPVQNIIDTSCLDKTNPAKRLMKYLEFAEVRYLVENLFISYDGMVSDERLGENYEKLCYEIIEKVVKVGASK